MSHALYVVLVVVIMVAVIGGAFWLAFRKSGKDWGSE